MNIKELRAFTDLAILCSTNLGNVMFLELPEGDKREVYLDEIIQNLTEIAKLSVKIVNEDKNKNKLGNLQSIYTKPVRAYLRKLMEEINKNVGDEDEGDDEE